MKLKHPTIFPSLEDQGVKRDESTESLRLDFGWSLCTETASTLVGAVLKP